MTTVRTLALASLLMLSFAPLALAQSITQPIKTDSSSGSSVPIKTNPQITGSSATGEKVTLVNPLGAGTNLEKLLLDILAFVIRIGTIVVIFMLVYTGYKFVSARGEPGAITEAKSMLMWTLIGALILLGAQAIAYGVKETVEALSPGR